MRESRQQRLHGDEMELKLKMSLAFKNRPLSTGAGKAVGGEPSSPSVPKTTKIGTFLRREETERGQQVRSVDVETANRQREKRWKKVEATYRERDEPQAAKTTPKEKAARTRLSTRMSRLKVEIRDEAEEEDTTHTMMQFGSFKNLTAGQGCQRGARGGRRRSGGYECGWLLLLVL
jgi:hypothetical protein